MDHPDHINHADFLERCQTRNVASVQWTGRRVNDDNIGSHSQLQRNHYLGHHATAYDSDDHPLFCAWINWTRLRTEPEAGEYLAAINRAIKATT